MLALAHLGQRTAALAQYEICRQILDEELGVEPGEETRRLYERIRDEDLSDRPQENPIEQAKKAWNPSSHFNSVYPLDLTGE